MLDSGEVEESLQSMSVSSYRCGSYSGHCVKRDGSAKKKEVLTHVLLMLLLLLLCGSSLKQ